MKKQLSDLRVLMGRMGQAFFLPSGLPADFSPETDLFEIEDGWPMPLSKGGVTFEPGAPDITREQITEGRTWYTFAEKGDDNISMQVPSLHVDLNELFLIKKGDEVEVKMKGKNYKGQGYSLQPKKVHGAWVFLDREETCMVVLPETDSYANLVGATGDAMGYYNVAVSTMPDANDVDVMIFNLVADPEKQPSVDEPVKNPGGGEEENGGE